MRRLSGNQNLKNSWEANEVMKTQGDGMIQLASCACLAASPMAGCLCGAWNLRNLVVLLCSYFVLGQVHTPTLKLESLSASLDDFLSITFHP